MSKRSARVPGPSWAVAFERSVDVATHPILASHVLKSRPVLPFALTLEWLAQGAMHAHPGLEFQGLDDPKLLRGVVLKGDSPARLRVLAGKAARDPSTGRFEVPVELRGADGNLHAAAKVLLGPGPASHGGETRAAMGNGDGGLEPYPRTVEEAYRDVLFHGPDLKTLEEVEGISSTAIEARSRTAPPPSAWMVEPLRSAWVLDPLALDAAFQVLILWSQERLGAPSLPCGARSYRQFRPAFPAEGIRIRARVTKLPQEGERGGLASADVDFETLEGSTVARLEGYLFAADPGLAPSFRSNRLETPAASQI